MRTNVFNYSQQRLLELGLDIIDVTLLNWFVYFFASNNMYTRTLKTSEGVERPFGWIKISKILEDLPVLGIATEKGIRRRLDYLVEIGVFERITVSSQQGKMSFYRTTELHDSLINSQKSDSSQGNCDSFAKKIVSQETKKTFAKSKNISDSSQRNCDSFAEESVSQRTKKTFADSENTSTSPQGNCGSFAESNSSSLAQGNCDSFALNNKTVKDIKIKNTAVFKNLADKYFGKNYFDSQFEYKAAVFFNSLNIKNYEDYFEFVKNKVQNKKLENPRGYTYKIFFSPDIVAEFISKQEEAEKNTKIKSDEEAKKTICPVCENKFNHQYFELCPVCGFDITKSSNLEEIVLNKKLFLLPKEKKEEYQKALLDIFNVNLSTFANMTDEEKKLKNNQQELEKKKLDVQFGLVS